MGKLVHTEGMSTLKDKKAAAREISAEKRARDLPPKRGLLSRFLIRFAYHMTRIFTRLRYEGQENIPKEGHYVLAANHVTYVDGMWIFCGLPREDYLNCCAMVGADLVTDHGLMGQIITLCARAVPVDRHGNPIRGLIRVKNAVQAGCNMLIHPEGTRSDTGRLVPMLSGAAYVAMKAQVPMVPIYIEGGYDLWPRQRRLPKLGFPFSPKRPRLTLRFGPPLFPEDYEKPAQMHAALEAWLQAEEKRYFKD